MFGVTGAVKKHLTNFAVQLDKRAKEAKEPVVREVLTILAQEIRDAVANEK